MDPPDNNAPHAGPLAFSTTGRGGSSRGRGRGAAAPPPSRFKPKNIRRNASELEEIARKEHERLAAIAAEKAREASRQARGRGRPLRGRGDAMGGSRGSGRKTTASGTFGIVPEALKSSTGGILSFSREGGGGGSGSAGGFRSAPGGAGGIKSTGGTGFKREGGGSHNSKGETDDGRAWFPEPQYPDNDESVPKVDIEHINLSSDEDDEPQFMGAQKKTGLSKGLKPIRILRTEHKARTVLVNTDSAVKSPPESDDEMKAEESPKAIRMPEAFMGASQDGDAVKIKNEPGTTPEPEELQIKSSPESRRKQQDSLASTIPMVIDSEDALAAAKDIKPPRQSKPHIKHVVHQTEEDRAEYHRHMIDVDILAKELNSLQSASQTSKSKGKGKDIDGDVKLDDLETTGAGDDQGNGRLYLIQFPPVLPELYNPKDPKPRNPILLKREEEEAAMRAKEDVEALGSMGAKGKNKVKDRPDLTGEPAPPLVKKEEEGVETTAEKLKREEEEKKKRGGKPAIVHEEGYVGKLIVRKSGKVEMIWGGIPMIVNRGIKTHFLQTGVIVDSVERGPAGGGTPVGKATGIGSIMGKLVVVPDWQKMLADPDNKN